MKAVKNKRRRRANTRSAAQRLADAEKVNKALELYVSGATSPQIATALGYANRGGAWKAVQRGLAGITRENAAATLELELLRLDRIYLGLVKAGAFKGDVPAARAALLVHERRAKYLGLDAAEKIEHSGTVAPDYAAMTDDELHRMRTERTRRS